MTVTLFPDPGSQLAYKPAPTGRALTSKAGAEVTVYVDTEHTTLAGITTLDGIPITGSVLVVDTDSLLPQFLDPDGHDVLYDQDGKPIYAFAGPADGPNPVAMALIF